MAEQVVVTDSSTTVAQVTVSDSTNEVATVNVSDVATLTGLQLEKLNSIAIGAEPDSLAWTRYATWAAKLGVATGADTETASAQVPMPYFDGGAVGDEQQAGRILWHIEGPVKSTFASTIIVKVKGVGPTGITATIATFTSTALAAGASPGFWNARIHMVALSRAVQRLTCTFEYQAASGGKVRETFWAAGTYTFSQDIDLRLDLTCGAGTLCDTSDTAIYVECAHFGRRTGTW